MSSLFEALAHLFHPRVSNNHRPRIIHPEGFLLLLGIVILSGFMLRQVVPQITKEGGVLGYSSSITQQKVIEETNREREKLGLSNLVENPQLDEAAKAKANDMFEHQYWSHYSPTGKSPWEFIKSQEYTYYVAGENLARDFMQTEDMLTAWMNSPTHRENILNPKYHDIGIAVVNGVMDGNETTLVVQMFGTQVNGVVAGQLDNGAEQVEIEQVPVPKLAQANPIQESGITNNSNSVLALSLQRLSLPKDSPIFSPLYLLKALFLAVIMLVLSVLMYDFVIINNRKTVRFVGKNFGHIALFLTVGFLVVFFKSGSIQ